MKFKTDESKWWDGAEFPPRDWQAEALPKLIDDLQSQGNNPDSEGSIIRAVMGAGKSFLIAELLNHTPPDRGECVVVTAPIQQLVKDLSSTIRGRVGKFSVGTFYAQSKEFDRPIVVACMDSALTLADRLEENGIDCGLLVVDECHRSETDQFKAAYDRLEPDRTLGFTATPWRNKSEELTLFDSLLYNYKPADAIRDGVVVPWEIRTWEGGDVDIDQACLEMVKEAHTQDLGPGVVNAVSCNDAEEFAEALRTADIPARAIHYQVSDSDQSRLLKQLERGDLRCLVHVSLLQEGVDMPWLRWGCLRRNVKSTVRFPQEVGRFLRANEGKDKAILYDPHGLFANMSIEYDAVLSGDLNNRDGPPIKVALDDIEKRTKDGVDPLVVEGRPELLDSLARYIRQVVVAFDTEGIVDRGGTGSGPWRDKAPTDKQLSAIWNMKWVLNPEFIDIPQPHRYALGWAIEKREGMNKGQASDLLSILYALKSVKRWPDLASMMATAPSES